MKVFTILLLAVMVACVLVTPAFAYVAHNKDANGNVTETAGPDSSILSGAAMGAGLGAALTLIGAGWGFGRIGASALEGMARQPEIAGQIQTAMIVIAALLEGATFFSLLVCLLINGKATW